MINIGVDTGGTYTDAVAIDEETGRVLAKGKAPTTKENLAIGIEQAIGSLPSDLLQSASSVTLSTTLATNACVENKGGEAKLVLVGMTKEIFDQVNVERDFGITRANVICVDSNSSYDGRVVDEPDWDRLVEDNAEWFATADALCIAAVFAMNNGGIVEKSAKAAFEKKFDVPVVAASELVSDLNVLERGATAMLNARLLTVVHEFIRVVGTSLEKYGVTARSLVVRSDGSLMSHSLAHKRPVDTILSGPAASVLGGHRLAKRENCLIIDMGGTTTDISIVRNGNPKMETGGIRIGGWVTQIKGVYVDTFALGGDSAVRIEEGNIALSNRRILPLCFAAMRWPSMKAELLKLIESRVTAYRDFHEFLYLVQEPKDLSRYASDEINLIKALRNGPRLIEYLNAEEEGVDKYRLNSERLESAGIIMRSGLTPTDMMHIKGDYGMFDKEAAELAAAFFTKSLPKFKGKSAVEFADIVYELVCKKMYENIVRILLIDRMPKAFAGELDKQTEALIAESWNRGGAGTLINLDFTTPAALVGVGAPIHVFLPRVAEVMGAECVIPEHAEVANAIGAVSADIKAVVRVEIIPIPGIGGPIGYTIHAPTKMHSVIKVEEAQEVALKFAEEAAIAEARDRGALGELHAEVHFESTRLSTGDGSEMSIGLTAVATATDRLN